MTQLGMTRARKKDQRHRAREAALQILYQWDIGGGDVERAAETFFGLQWPDAESPADSLRDFASALARDTCCDTMMEARLAKPGSVSRSGTSPAIRRTDAPKSLKFPLHEASGERAKAR